MLVMCGSLAFKAEDHDYVVDGLRDVAAKSRQDPGCIEYWWAEDVDEPNTFRFFECWETREQFEQHRAQPYEDQFMHEYVSRITGADAYEYEVGTRRSAMG